jgi:FMN reductase
MTNGQTAGSTRPMKAPYIIGLGGTTRARSTSEMVLRAVLREAEVLGARAELIAGPDLVLPIYAPESTHRDPAATRLIEALRCCDGVIIASPGYHGSISGLIKNALDYTEDLRDDKRPYFDGRAVGCIGCANGWQATGSVLAALRSIVHALRGWPTPLGITANTLDDLFDRDGVCRDQGFAVQLRVMAQQVMVFADLMRTHSSAPAADQASQ